MGLRLLALACLVGAAFAGPFQRETGSQCSTHCPNPSNPNFEYEVGKKYVYEYHGENYITAAGQQKQKASIEGLAEFHWNTRCEGVLKLKNVRVQQKLSPEEIETLVQELEMPVSYAYEDGKIERVCPNSEDSTQSLNIKKGVLSTIINTMSKLDSPQEVKEVDSLGNCATKYTVKYSNGLEIQKEKNLKSCTNRHSSVTSLITNPYDAPESSVHTLPIFPEEQLICKQQIEDKVIQSVVCKEIATIKPLKNRDSVIQFEGMVELNLLRKESAERFRSHQPSGQEPIMYNLDQEVSTESQERETQQLLRELCSKNQGVMDTSVSQDFIRLVSIIKTLPYQSLDQLYQSLKSGRLCSQKKVLDLFVDTLPMAGTDSSVKLMVQLLEDKEISGLKTKLWPASLALIPKPSQKTVEAVVPLTKMIDSAPVLLGVSAMLHRFCSIYNCYQETAVQEIVSNLNQYLGEQCSSSEEEQIFKVLKAFGNIGHLGQAKQNILACAKDNSKLLRLRLAAIDAFRRSPEKRPQELLNIYVDMEEEPELRIAALSSVLRKADQQQIQTIKRVAEQETDEQVSGYVSTIIENMKKTSSPLKKHVKSLLKEVQVSSPRVNYWENSKNIEMSAFSETINVGAAVEADIIHSSESKIPRSMYTRFDVDVFDRSMNLLEIGVRAEGLESLLKKLIGLKDKMPQKPSWDLLNAKSIFGGVEADASLFIRTMNTEIFDVAASDLSAMGELVQIAELMQKLAQEKTADFSHSFLFLNSELVIPSVTGRSYSIALTGSATVGLTASSKCDVLSFPRSSDVYAHFQPSANVEISTTVGIKSNQHRPDIKLVSRMHMESDMKAKFQIKDGHIALLSMSLPSENIAMAKMSSDVVEIDTHHHEKRVFEKMQTKIDYCFDQLKKPFGVSVCGKWNVPKPFITKTFPFVNGVGDIEIAIKKSDPRFTSFELEVEIPKHSAPHMKYRASLDTPGSQVSRRFAAELDVKQRSKSQNEFSLELTSPFKTVGGSGSYTWKENLIQGSLEMHSTSSRLFSVNASTEVAASRFRTILKPTLQVSWANRKPLTVGGAVSLIRGKKEQIVFDIKANQPTEKPLALKGTIMKEGEFELSQSADWKLSSDLNVECPLGDAQIRSAVEKRSQQAQTISTSFSADYQLRHQSKQTVKFAATSQKSLSKLSTNAQLELTQFPSCSWAANWDMQGDIRETLKNDITLRYGSEQSYINIKQRSSIPPQGRGQCKVSVKAPQLSLDSELTVTHEIQLSETPKIYLETDLAYVADKHVRSLIDINLQSRQPLKASSKLELEFPGKKISYSDEIEQTTQKTFEGKCRLQWSEQSQIELKYKYENHSDHQTQHHEIESSLVTPFRSSPLKSKASIRLNKQSLGLQTQLSLNRESEYILETQLNRMGVSHIKVKTPQMDANAKLNNERQKKAVSVDLKLKSRKPRHVVGSAMMDLEDKKKFNIELQLDADHNPEQKIVASTVIARSGRSLTSSSKLQILDLFTVSLAEFGTPSIIGDHEGTLEVSMKNQEPVTLKYKQEMSQNRLACSVEYSKNNIRKAEIQLQGNYVNTRNQRELSTTASIKCLDNSFESKKLSMRHKFSKSGSSMVMKNEMQVQNGQRQTYKAEWNSEMQPSGLEMTAQLNTPHENFEKQALGVSYQRSDDALSWSLNVEAPGNKVVSFSTDLQRRNRGLVASVNVKSPFQVMRDGKLFMSMENQRTQKSIQCAIDVNNVRMTDIEASYTKPSSSETQCKAQIKVSPMKNIELQGISVNYQKSRSLTSIETKVELKNNKEISSSVELKKERNTISATASLNTPYNKVRSAKAHMSIENQPSKRNLMLFVEANNNRQCDCEISMVKSASSVEMQGRMKTIRTPEISSQIKISRNGPSFSVSSKVVKGPSPQSSPRSLQRLQRSEQVILDLDISNQVSNDDLKFALKAQGPFSPLTLTASSSRSDRNSIDVNAEACMESEEQSCYKLTASHKALKNEESYRIYRKVSVQLEKTSRSSAPESLGNIQFYLSAGDNDYRSKVVCQIQQKNLGYEILIHRKSHESDPCTIDAHLFLPESTSRARVSVLHSKQQKMIELEAIPDVEQPNKKFSIEMKQETNPRNKEMSCYLQASTPSMEKPLSFSGRMQRQGKFLIKSRAELQYSSQSGKALIFEIEPQVQSSRSGMQSVVCKLYSEDKSLEAIATVMQQRTQEQNKVEYEWSWKSSKGQKRGGASINLSQRNSRQPQQITIAYFTPSSDVKIQGNVWTPEAPQMSLSVMSQGQNIKEIVIRTTDSCVEFDVNRSGPQFKSSFCLNKREGNALHFVSIDAHYQQKRILDIQVGVNPENPEFLEVALEWKKAELLRAFTELTGLEDLLHDRSLEDLEEELKERIETLLDDVVRPFFKDIFRQMRHMKNKQARKLRQAVQGQSQAMQMQWQKVQEWREAAMEKLNSLTQLIPFQYMKTEVWEPIYHTFECVAEGYLKLVYEHIPEISNVIYDLTKTQFEKCLKKFCTQDTFCYNFVKSYQRHGLKQVKQTIQKRISETQRSMKQAWEQCKQQLQFPNAARYIEEYVKYVQETFDRVLGKFLGHRVVKQIAEYGKQLESELREKAIDFLDYAIQKFNEIIRRAERDEDFKTARALIRTAEKKLRKAWSNKEQLAKKAWEPVEENVMQTVQKTFQDRVEVQTYNPKQGEIRFRVRNPLAPAHIEVIQNELRTIKRKIQQAIQQSL